MIEPVFSASELADARGDCVARGTCRRSARMPRTAMPRRRVRRWRRSLRASAAECTAAAARAEQSAEAIARLLFDSLAATFPALCARYGDAEVRAVVRAVLPALTQEQAITVRAHPRHRRSGGAGVRAAGSRSGRACADDRMRCDAAGRRAHRLAQRRRDAGCRGLWQQVAEVLVPAGLMRADA